LKITTRRNGEPRATLRVAYHLNAEELVNALSSAVSTYEVLEELPAIMSRAKVEKHIKSALNERGEDASHEDSECDEEYRTWARNQINHHFFPATKN
jgi:hypothetical protein